MSTELPWYKFYPTEWLFGRISHESNDLQISFLKTCCFYWQRDCDLDLDYLLLYINKEVIHELHKKNYIIYNKKSNRIKIKFLDKQSKERTEKKSKRVESGRKGGLKSASMRKRKTYEDYVQEAMKHDDPAQCLSREVAEILIKGKIKRGEITV
jgi:hypothetical protein|tara:strand:- start:1189 stop:1650 length:462 start_codon:yes stop_codon:yes gene_type:complete